MPDGSGAMHPFLDVARAAAAVSTPVAWLSALRRDATERYAAAGLPGRRNEYWRYTNLNALAESGFALADDRALADIPPLANRAVVALEGHRIVFVNGRLRSDLCVLDGLPDGVLISGLADMLSSAPQRLEPWLGQIADLDGMPMAALNTAFLGDGMVLLVDVGVTVDMPIHLISIGAPGDDGVTFQPRNLVVLGDGASATLIESHIGAPGDAGYFTNIVTELSVGEGGSLYHYKAQEDAATAFHMALTDARLAGGSTYDSFVLQTGGAIGRNEVRVRLAGEGIDCALNGVYLASDGQLLDNTTLVDPQAPSCRSRQIFKGVLDGRARGVFQGKIHVRREAQKTDGHQLSRTLLLSPRAEIDTRPELEIYADDVKCSHGATTGDLDEDSLFYLLSRGIEPAMARRLLVGAFVGDALAHIRQPQVAEDFTAHIRNWLDRHVGAAPGLGDDTP